MRKSIFTCVFIILLPVLGVASNGVDKDFSAQSTLKTFLTANQYSAQSLKSFETFLNKLDRKHASVKNERDFLQQVFSKTHQRFLKSFMAYATLDETFANGSYNCLTGTILYSLILHHYGIEHQVIETNYHIFILAETQQGQVLLEATDPLNGFVDSPKEIENRIETYKQNEIRVEQANKSYYKFKVELYNRVSIDELRGLLHFNMAVNAYNQDNLQRAVQHFVKADALYSSSRTDEFSQILLLSLHQSKLDLKTKENCMNTILSLRQKSLPVVASN